MGPTGGSGPSGVSSITQNAKFASRRDVIRHRKELYMSENKNLGNQDALETVQNQLEEYLNLTNSPNSGVNSSTIQ